jgi:hypothetical protein
MADATFVPAKQKNKAIKNTLITFMITQKNWANIHASLHTYIAYGFKYAAKLLLFLEQRKDICLKKLKT